MTAYGYADPALAGMVKGFGDARTVDPVILQEAIPFGQPVFGYAGQSPAKGWGFKKDTAKIVYSTDFVASNSTIVTVNGVATDAVVYATSHAVTIAAIVTAIKAKGFDAVLDASDTNSRTILVRSKGATITADSATTGGSGQPTDTVTYSSGQMFLGVHVFKHVDPSKSPAQYDVADVLRIGVITGSTASGSALKKGMPAYVATTGKFASSGDAISTVKYMSNETDTPAFVDVEVDGTAAMTYGQTAF